MGDSGVSSLWLFAPAGEAGAAHKRLAALPTTRHVRRDKDYAAIAAARSAAAARTMAERGKLVQRGPGKRMK